MKDLFSEVGIIISQEEYEKFEEYYNLLCFYNEKFNITAIKDKKDVYIKNFIDSVLFIEEFTGNSLIDIGSGGGFPALPIKILKPSLSLTMIEATGKKCEFLSEVVKKLELKEVKIINGRAEDLALKSAFRENYDMCSARAVSRLNMLSEYCLPFVKTGGKFLAFKAKAEEEIEEGKNAIKLLGGRIDKIITKDLFSNTRTLVVVEKITRTDIVYPRKNGIIRKKPL